MLINILGKQKGQAIPIGMALFLVLGLMSFVLFNTGQTVSDKSRIVNTADSAAYSGLLWQARAMNFQAYTNRAMVANQVAMAQAVSINSWSAYIKKTGQNLNTAFGWVPYVGAVTAILERVGEGIDLVLKPISQGMLSVVNAVNMSLSVAQDAMYYSAFVATPDVVNSVVKSNSAKVVGADSNFDWTTAFSLANTGLNLLDWKDFTEDSDVHKELAENERYHMINASLDKFSKERNWKFFNFFIPITPLNWVRFEKAGSTHLFRRDGKYEWYAKDALSLRQKIYYWRGRKHYDLPISGASSFANSDSSSNTILGREPIFFRGRHRIAQSSTAGGFAEGTRLSVHEGRSMRNYGGIHAYRSLSKVRRDHEDPPTMLLRIQVNMKTDDIMDSDVMAEQGRFATSVETPGQVMSSVATAEMYFEKPCFDANCVVEYANGYSPYWDVRLVNTSGLSRLAAHTTQNFDVVPDSLASKDLSLERLPTYNRKLANPITDYQEQAKGVKIVIAGMENHLTSMVVDSPEYQQYKTRLDNIKANVTFELDGIVDQFIEQNFNEDEIVDEIAKAAGYDLEIGEFQKVEDYIAQAFPDIEAVRNMTTDQVSDMIEQGVNDLADDLKERAKQEVRTILKNAVQNILAGMVADYVQQATGYTIPGDVINQASSDAADSLISGAENALANDNTIDGDDIQIDLNNECTMWESVNQAEREVEDMQRRLEDINQEIAIKFHAELEVETDAANDRRDALSLEMDAVRAEIHDINTPPFSMNDEDRDRELRRLGQRLTALQGSYDGVPNDRVHKLTEKLMLISDAATASEFPDYRLEYRYAKDAVVQTLGDIQVLEVDDDGNPVSDSLLLSEFGDELDSDRDQAFTEKPAGCP